MLEGPIRKENLITLYKNRIVESYKKGDESEKARLLNEFCDEGEIIVAQTEGDIASIQFYFDLGCIYSEIGEIDIAREKFESCLECARNASHKEGVAKLLEEISRKLEEIEIE